MSEEQLSALLRLKRYEKPRAGYFDRLLQDVHRRQREELLQRPLWQIAVERIRVLFSEHSMGHLTYAGSMAAILVAGVAAIGLMTRGEGQGGTQASVVVAPPVAAADRTLRLEVAAPSNVSARTLPVAQPEPVEPAARPRYIIDARPVSYEPSRHFAF